MKKFICAAASAMLLISAAAAQTLYPVNGEKNAAYDGQLVITFDAPQKISADTKVEILDASGSVVSWQH